jgi:hypothetical protein
LGSDTLIVDDSNDAAGRVVNFNTAPRAGGDGAPYQGQITGLAPATITYTYGSTNYVSVTTGYGTNTVNVLATGATTFVSDPGVHDTFNVGDEGRLSNIDAYLGISGSGQTQLNVNDWNDPAGHTVYLENGWWSGTIAGLAPAPIGYSPNLGGLNITTGSGSNTFDVYTTYCPTTLTGNGQDTVNVGYNGSLSMINGQLMVNNWEGSTALNINDMADVGQHSPTLSSFLRWDDKYYGSITGLAPAAIDFAWEDMSAHSVQISDNAADVWTINPDALDSVVGVVVFVNGKPIN